MTTLEIATTAGLRTVTLGDYLDPADEERAQEDAYRWIKSLREARVDGRSFRTRFTLRGDSLWWFAELYLHKEQVILEIMRTLSAFDALVDRERPLAVRLVGGDSRVPSILVTVARARRVPLTLGQPAQATTRGLSRLDARARALALAASLSRFRGSKPPVRRARVAAFVHRAFWRADTGDGSAESYIGPVLREIERRLPRGEIRYVGVGPRRNFRARRWWQALLPSSGGSMVSIERYASRSALSPSLEIWRQRYATRRALWSSQDIRQHAVIRGCDCWEIVREQLAGIALLQFPWSARAMDEAAAALLTIEPDVAVTYAEAGGWGRALALECRRAQVPLAGIQHGFIYRHWLNYRHEPDEMQPDPASTADAGFPRPTVTLLFDDYAARHLRDAGHFPPDALQVTGSARLDELVAAVNRLTLTEIVVRRESVGVRKGDALILFVAKYKEAAPYLPRLYAAVAGMSNVRLVIKPHPAETPDVYAAGLTGTTNTVLLQSAVDLPELLAAARAIVTVNSTVALDALSVGVPSLVIGLPNNLSPLVDAGVLAGADSEEEIRAILTRLLYDEEFRRQLRRASDDFLRRTRPEQDGGAAARAAASVIALAEARVGAPHSSLEGP